MYKVINNSDQVISIGRLSLRPGESTKIENIPPGLGPLQKTRKVAIVADDVQVYPSATEDKSEVAARIEHLQEKSGSKNKDEKGGNC